MIDRGPGIPPEARDRVFAPFQRLGDTDNTTGVGLGLALARGLTEVMGGTLTPRGDARRRADHGRVAQRRPGARPAPQPEPGRRERRAEPAARTEAEP